MSRHQYLGFAAVNLASDTLSRLHPEDARLDGSRLFAKFLRATCRSSASATECSTSTPANHSIFNRLMANHRPTKQASSFEFARPSFIRLGIDGLFETTDHRQNDRSSRRVYPNLTNPDTLCRDPVSFPDRKIFEERRSCGADPFRTRPPSSSGRAC